MSHTHKGIAYFDTLSEARMFEEKHCRLYPDSRPVGYERGWAVQVKPSGDYLGPDGTPSLMARDYATVRAVYPHAYQSWGLRLCFIFVAMRELGHGITAEAAWASARAAIAKAKGI